MNNNYFYLGCQIGDEGAKYIAHSLKHNKFVVSLELGSMLRKLHFSAQANFHSQIMTLEMKGQSTLQIISK